jgi:hypothetical protein
MVRPTHDLDSCQDEISDWFTRGDTIDTIVERLNQQFQVVSSVRTIKRRLHKWGIQRRTTTVDTPELRAQVAILFHMNLSDLKIVRALKQSGIPIEVTGVVRIRKSQGLVRRMTPFERFRSDQRLFEVLKQELENGRVEGYGMRLLYTHFRTNGHLVAR